MNLKIKKGYLFAFLYLLIFLIYVVTKKNVVLYGTCIISLLGLFTGALSLEMTFIMSVIVGSELACFINIFICIFFLFIKKKFSIIRCEKKVTVLVAILLAMALVNMVISGAVFNALFGIMYYAIIFLISISLKGNIDEIRLVNAVKVGLIFQIVCGLVIIVLEKNFSPGDIHRGTFGDANYSVIFLIIAVICIIKYNRSRGMTFRQILKKECIYIGGAIVFIVLGSAKNILVGLALAIIVYSIAKKITKNRFRQVITSIAIIYTAMICGIVLIHSPRINSFLMRVAPWQLGIYFYDEEYSFKYDYFEGTIFEELAGPRLLFGYGVGQYGSRSANMFGYNSMYRGDNSINRFISTHFDEEILPNYKKYASKYSKEIVEGIRWRSAILTYPFSSVIAFLAETGVIGLLFMSYIWGRAGNKSKYCFLVVFLFSICIFDIYFDHICVTALIVTLLLSDRKIEGERKNI